MIAQSQYSDCDKRDQLAMEDRAVQLMLRVADGDDEAFATLFRDFQVPVERFIIQYVHRRDLAAELTQEVFLRVYKSRQNYTPQARFSSWLFRIARNMALNTIRSPKYHREVAFSSVAKTIDDQHFLDICDDDRDGDPLERAEKRSHVRTALSQLNARQREAVHLCFYEQLPYRDIADRMGCSNKAVKSLLARARSTLKYTLAANI